MKQEDPDSKSEGNNDTQLKKTIRILRNKDNPAHGTTKQTQLKKTIQKLRGKE